MKVAFITGITGQDGSYLAELLLEKNYKVHISLTNRKKMKYPVLIGRRFLNKFKYMVNVRKKNINDRAKAV